MIARILLFIKHRIPWLWIGIDWLNARLYGILQQDNMAQKAERAFDQFKLAGFEFRPLVESELYDLKALLERQKSERLDYFRPHDFDYASLRKMYANPAFLMFGVFSEQRMIGYFFLRCFWNRKCFVGRLLDQPFEGKGIGRVMNQIMYNTAWWSGFRCFTSISRNNRWIMRAHAKNPHAKFISDLANGYQLVEFLPSTEDDPTA
jgi:hypothetical protein